MSAQDKLDRSAAKHGLGSDERKRKIQKAKDFFSKPVPTYSKDELRKMGHPVEAYRKPTQAEIDADKRKERKASGEKRPSASYKSLKKKVYGNAMGGLKDAAGQEFTAVPVNTAGDVSGGDRKSIEKLSAMMQKRSKDMRQKEENIHFVKVGDGRDHMIVKTKADKPSDAVKKIKAQYPNDRVKLHKEELDEAADFMKMSKELLKHKSKGIEYEKAAAYVRAIHNNSNVNVQDKAFMGLTKMLKDMEDFTKRTTITKILKDNGFKVKGGKLMRESVATADKKPQNYRDPETGKLKTRMVPVDKDVVRGNDAAKVVTKKKFKDVR